jgi:general secretion pathway protein A
MYLEYWGLTKKPFKNTPDPRFLYESVEHEEALVKMVYTIEEGMGAALLTGVFGCGKTVISQALLHRLSSEQYQIAYVTNPQLEYVDLLRAIVRNLKAVDLPVRKTDLSADALLEILEGILNNNARDGKSTVVIIDEAHIITDPRIFEGLRLLLNFQTQDRFLLTLLLLGQPELRQHIEDNKQLEQRLAIKCHLESFDYADVCKYISHRLGVAGCRRQLFDDGALQRVYERSGGIPRRINRICDLSLLVGYSQGTRVIDAGTVDEAIKTMGT